MKDSSTRPSRFKAGTSPDSAIMDAFQIKVHHMPEKIIRTICIFTRHPQQAQLSRLNSLAARFQRRGYTIQTLRLCAPDPAAVLELDALSDGSTFLSMGALDFETAEHLLPDFLSAKNVAFNLDLTRTAIDSRHTDMFFHLADVKPAKTFSFAYTFNNVPGSPFFPSAKYERDGFAVGLQPTNLSEGCRTMEEWLDRMRETWLEIDALMANEADFLGIDTSIAPLYEGDGSFFHLVRRMSGPIDRAVTSDTFLKITKFIKEKGPRNTGLCGLMFPCLEDFEMAAEYERGNFTIERNIFLSLHSGLGIDTYPVGKDENAERLLEILKLVQGLSNKYSKPLSIRFISDGRTRIGEQASFDNEYLKNVTIRSL